MTNFKPEALIYGGSFDPFHNGHLQTARLVCARYGLPSVSILINPGLSPDKRTCQNNTTRYHRVSVLLRLSRDYAFLQPELCEMLMKTDSTYASLSWMREHLHLHQPGFVLGSDQFMQLHRWRHAEELLSMALWVVIPRQGKEHSISFDAIEQQKQQLQSRGARIDIVDAQVDSVSSTQVRRLIGAGERIKDLVPACVADYLSEFSLYREQAS